MNRRDALRFLAGTAAFPVVPQDLLALGRRLRVTRSRTRALDARQTETVATIAELIVPETDTPGARAAGVPEFIDLMLAEWYDAEDRERFAQGLADVDARARALWGRPYVECAPAQQTHLLTVLDQEVTAAREARADPGRHFFHTMKRLTLIGYYTSEIGATRELHYRTIPGRLEGCVPFQSGGG
jgi:hypothetical protein